MRKDNLEQHLQGYGDYFRGVSIDTPPESLTENWQVSDWRDGWNAAKDGVEVSHKAVVEAEAARAEALRALEAEAAAKAQLEAQGNTPSGG